MVPLDRALVSSYRLSIVTRRRKVVSGMIDRFISLRVNRL